METQTQRDSTQPICQRRPFLLRVLFLLFVLWSVLGLLRFARGLIDRSLILELLDLGVYWYFLISGLTSGLAAWPALWGIMRRSNWAPTLIWVLSVLYPVFYWIERLFLWVDPEAVDNWLFMLLLTMLWFGVVFWALRSKRGNSFFLAVTKE